MRIIGIELRIEYQHPRYGNQRREVALIPCDVELVINDLPEHSGYIPYPYINMTLHTECGDINIPNTQFPFTLDDFKSGLHHRSNR